MRAFVAVVPPASSLASLLDVVTPLRPALHASWTPPERLHLTLAFLGDVEDPAPYGEALAEAVRGTQPFGLRIVGGGAFPRPRRARVLWAGVEGDVEALGNVARVARRAAKACRIEVAREKYVPHVTVARVRAKDADATATVAALNEISGEPWTVGEVVLMRSVLGPRPRYEPLRTCAF